MENHFTNGKNADSKRPGSCVRMSVNHRTHHTPVTCHDDESSSTIEAGPAGPTYAIARQSGLRREARKRPLHRHQRTGENASRLSSPERASAKIAQMLEVARNEVAVLRLEKGSLKFVYPPELRAAGVIPVSSSAVAARTAATGTSLLSNSFARMKHASLFESVRLGGKDDNQASELMPIQKIMSVPVSEPGGKLWGLFRSPVRASTPRSPAWTLRLEISSVWSKLPAFWPACLS